MPARGGVGKQREDAVYLVVCIGGGVGGVGGRG